MQKLKCKMTATSARIGLSAHLSICTLHFAFCIFPLSAVAGERPRDAASKPSAAFVPASQTEAAPTNVEQQIEPLVGRLFQRRDHPAVWQRRRVIKPQAALGKMLARHDHRFADA